MKKIISILIFISVIILFPLQNQAVQKISLRLENEPHAVGDIFEVTLQVSEIAISAIQVELHFDEKKIECISTENSNLNIMENQVNYLWYDESGESSDINKDLITFSFRVKELGNISIGINGIGYNSNGDEIGIGFEGIEMNIGNQDSNYVKTSEDMDNGNENIESDNIGNVDNKNPDEQNADNVNIDGQFESVQAEQNIKDNSYLKTLRINEEGIEPDFKKDVYEYYFITENQELKNLEITAIPENEKSTVVVTGNTNLKNGLNQIKIEVISESGKNKSIYNIWVTKTNDVNLANSNLETLAIEGVNLEPEFQKNILKYNVEVANTVETIRVLAIPENINATVDISKDEKLQIGDNNVSITIVAENGFTKKIYDVIIHRRTEAEEQEYQEKITENQEKLAELLSISEDGGGVDGKSTENQESKSSSNKINIFVEFLIVIAISILIFYAWRYWEKKRLK